MSTNLARSGGIRRVVAWMMLPLCVNYAGVDLLHAVVNEDYPGTSIDGRNSVAIVKSPAGTLVNTWNANLMLPRSELFVPSQGIPLEFSLRYNSLLNLVDGPFGYGWSFSYGLHVAPQPSGDVLLQWGDGRRDLFTPSGPAFEPVNEGVFLSLAATGPGTYRVCTPEQICYRFDSPAHGKLTSITEPSGNQVTLQYDAAANLISVRDTHGFAFLFHYDGQGRVVEAVDSATLPSRILRYGYSAAGDLVRVEDELGNVTTYGYVCPHLLSRITDAVGTTTDIDYTPAAQVSRIENSIERSTFGYDPFQQITSINERIDPSTSRTSRFRYNSMDRLFQKIDPLGGIEVSAYDAAGQLQSLMSPGGKNTSFTWDASGGLLTRTNHAGGTQTWTYDPVFHKPQSYEDPMGHATSLTYDALGRLATFTFNGADFWSFTYDGQGRVSTATDARGNTSSYTYDSYGNRTALVPPGGGAPFRYAYDSLHRLTRKITPLGHTTQFEYDAADRLIRTIDPLGGAHALSYDALDRPLSLTDPTMRVHGFDRDAVGRLVEYTAPGGATTTYTYDDVSRLVALTDAGSHTTSYTYDALNRRLNWSDPLGQTTSFTYDADGNRLTRTDADLQVTTFSYDTLNRLIGMDQPGTADDATYEYDGDGKLTRALNGHADFNFAYDGEDRMVTAQDLVSGRTLGMTYDANGNRATLTDPDSGLFTYGYDAMDRIDRIIDPLNRTTSYTYDAAGRPQTLTQPNGVTTTYQHDGANRLLRIQTRRADLSTVFDGQYSYDAAGNRTQSIENGQTITYTYDTPGRLARAAYSSGRVIDYTYDVDGNRTRRADTLTGTTDYTYDVAERLLSSTGADAATYAYDPKGNRISRTAGPSVTTYSYSTRNDLTQVVLPGGSTVDYSYDALGRRTRAQRPGGPPAETQFTRDPLLGGNVISEHDGTGSRTARYTSAETMNSYLTYEGPAGSLFLHGDRLRTTRAATDGAGAIQASFDYLPYGEPESTVGSIGDRTFTGADQGAAPGLIHLRNRDYDSATARFLQRDPRAPTTFDPPNLNPYVYVANSPQTYVDPTGEWFLAIIAVVAVVVIVVAVVETFSAGKDTLEKGEEFSKNRERIAETVSNNPSQGADIETMHAGSKEALNDALKSANDAATSYPGTTWTGAPDVPDDAGKAAAWSFLQVWDWLFKPKVELRTPKIAPKQSDAGPQSYRMEGANSLDGVESVVGYAQGGSELANCGAAFGSFAGPGAGLIYGVTVDPADSTLFLVGEGDPFGLNLYHARQDGTILNQAPIPFLSGGRGVSLQGNDLYITRYLGSASQIARMTKNPMQITARWIVNGTGNPNPVSIPGASDVHLTGVQGPNGGAVALVSSVLDANIRIVELVANQPPNVSSSWFLLGTRVNPTNQPSTTIGATPAGLLTAWNGTMTLHDPFDGAIVDSCPSPAGASTFGIDGDPGDGSVWAISPPADDVVHGSAPGGAPATDGDADAVPDTCDNCLTNFNTTQVDGDGDGWGDDCECAPADPSIHPGAKEICADGLDNDCDGLTDAASPFCASVADVTNLRLFHAQPNFTWNPVSGAGGYDLIRARRENLIQGGGIVSLGPVSCIDLDSPDPQATVDPLVPEVGRVFIYLARVHHGQAVYGRSTAGLPNVPTSGDCPMAP